MGRWAFVVIVVSPSWLVVYPPHMEHSFTYIKKLVEMGYMHHQRCEIERRSVRVRLTPRGREIRDVVGGLFARHAEGLESRGVLGPDGIEDITAALRRVERYWADQIRYIY
jgi:hypothetical protein